MAAVEYTFLTGVNDDGVRAFVQSPNGTDYLLQVTNAGGIQTSYQGSGVPLTDGENNTASNVGGDEFLFKQKTGVDLEFKGMTAGTNIVLTSGANAITIGTSSAVLTNVVEDLTPQLGGNLDINGKAIVGAVTVSGAVTVTSTIEPTVSGTQDIGTASLPFRTIYADDIIDTSGGSTAANVAVLSGRVDANEVNIAFVSGIADSKEANTASNIGNAAEVFSAKNGVDFEFRTLQAGENIVITSGSNTLLISGTVPASEYVQAYATGIQAIASADTFQDITFDHNSVISANMTHTEGTANFAPSLAGDYKVAWSAVFEKTGTGLAKPEIIVDYNGSEVLGSQSMLEVSAKNLEMRMSNITIVSVTGIADVLKLRIASDNDTVQILPAGANSSRPVSAAITINKL